MCRATLRWWRTSRTTLRHQFCVSSLEGPFRPSTLVLMVQREVGERLGGEARQDERAVGFRSVVCACRYRSAGATNIVHAAPAVSSVILRLRMHDNPPIPSDELPYLFRGGEGWIWRET